MESVTLPLYSLSVKHGLLKIIMFSLGRIFIRPPLVLFKGFICYLF